VSELKKAVLGLVVLASGMTAAMAQEVIIEPPGVKVAPPELKSNGATGRLSKNDAE
jgi:hypothetical protein